MRILVCFALLFVGAEINPIFGAAKMKLDNKVRVRCVKLLRAGLTSDEFWPSMHAAEALTLAGYGVLVRHKLHDRYVKETDDQRRCGLARELARAGEDRSRVLMGILEKKDDHGHVHAAESLYKVGWRGDGTPLRKGFAQESNVRLRLMAAAALGKRGDEAAMKFLREHIAQEKDPKLFFLSAWVLGRIGESSDCELIRKRLPDAPDAWTRAFLEHALAALGDKQGQQALVRNLKSEDARLRTYAAVFAGEIGLVKTKAQLIKQLDDENLDARIRAAQSLLVLSR